MGEYEPKDSRNVTLKPGHEPGGIERTGPKEAEARRKADEKLPDPKTGNLREPGNEGVPNSKATHLDEPQQRQRQSQDGQSQSQSQQRELNNQQPEGSPLSGNQPQAIDAPSGGARPEYDQYETNQPSNLHQGGVEANADPAVENGPIGEGAPGQTATDAPRPANAAPEQQPAGSVGNTEAHAQAAYGNSHAAGGPEEQDVARSEKEEEEEEVDEPAEKQAGRPDDEKSTEGDPEPVIPPAMEEAEGRVSSDPADTAAMDAARPLGSD